MPAPEAKPEETLLLHQANERTLLAWIRTGIALMAFGFAIARFGLFLRELASVGTPAPRATSGLGAAWFRTVPVPPCGGSQGVRPPSSSWGHRSFSATSR
jgi:hypothetical protein